MLKNREKRAFWLFVIWVAALPLMFQPDLSAQDDEELIIDTEVPEEPADAGAPATGTDTEAATTETASGSAEPAAGEASQTEPLPDVPAGDAAPADAAPVEGAEPVADGGEEAVIDTGEAAGEGGEEAAEGETPAAMPALSADPNMLLGKVNGLSKAGKHKEVVAELQEFEDAVVESNELLAIYVEALIKTDKPDWNTVNRVARVLGAKDNSSSLANYAQGLYWQNTKKPDNSKAVMYFGKAKAAKTPYPGASTAYYIALVKSYWIILLAVVALPVVAVVQKKKKQKAALAALAETPAAEGAEPAPAGGDPAAKLQELLQTPEAAAKPADAKPADAKPVAAQTEPVTSAGKDTADAGKVAKTDQKTETQAAPAKEAGSTTTRKVVKVVRKVKAAKPKDADEVVEEIIEEEPPAKPFVPYRPGQSSTPVAPSVSPVNTPADEYGTISAKRRAEIEQIREMARPERRPSVQADPELDALWSNLSRKALAGRIGPHARRQDAISAARSSSPSFSPLAGQKESDIDFNTSDLSIDLSDEALREDLIGKLKMLCISDGELRELFAMKNAAHIPHLIEYVLTKPEPLRLSFVARELGHYGDPAVIDTLASLLYHKDERVALAAIQGLENSKKPAAVLHLCPFLRSEIPLLAQAARTALSNFGAVKILQAFKNLPDHSDEKIREAGVFVLSRMKGNAVEELLKKMLHDDSLEVRTRVILAMSYQKNPVYIDALREFFRIAAESDKAMARKAIVYLQGFVERQK